MKHLIRYILGLVPTALIIGLGLLYHFQLWIPLLAALICAPYLVGWIFGKIFFVPTGIEE